MTGVEIMGVIWLLNFIYAVATGNPPVDVSLPNIPPVLLGG